MSNDNKIRILHVIYSFDLGGMESVLVDLINNMDTNKFENFICCLTKNGNASARLINPTLKIYECHKKEGLDLSIVSKIRGIISNDNIDIIHGRAWVSLIPCILAKLLSSKRVKVVFGYHGQNYSEKEIAGRNIKRLILQKLLLQFADVIYTLSRSLRNYYSYQTGISKRKIIVIPNGINFNLRDTKEEELYKLKKQYKIGNEDIVIGFLGRLDKVKNISLIIKAFQIVKEKHNKLKLLIVGTGTDELELKEIANNLSLINSVVFTGWVDNPDVFYKIMHIYVQPSLFEGMSGSIARAMLNQLPVITTNVGGNPDLVINNQTGYLIETNNPDQLVELLIKLIDSAELRRSIGFAGSEYIKNHYSLNNMVNNYASVYESLAENN